MGVKISRMATTSSSPDPEVPAKAVRRRFTAAEKARILDAYEAASAIERAAICRRERIHSSLLSNWRKRRENPGGPDVFVVGARNVGHLSEMRRSIDREDARMPKLITRALIAALFASCLVRASVAVADEAQTPAFPASSLPDARSNVDALVGWPAGPAVVRERAWEEQFMRVPSAAAAAAIEDHISAVPHRAGTPADIATANFVRDRLRADGFSVEMVPFDVLYTSPTKQALEIVAPAKTSFDLLEGDPAHHTDAERLAGPSFMENSGDGDVTAPLFYLNHGTSEDWAAFDDLGVAMPKGAIVIERLGAFSRDPRAGAKAWEALNKHGVAGLIFYADPADDGVYGGVSWPAGNWKNRYMAERIGGPKPGVGAVAPPGDPTLPGEAPVVGKKHLTWEQTDHADIPEMNVTQAVARALMTGLDGPVVPEGWHDGFEMLEHIGGNETVHLAVRMDRHLTRIYDVIGTMRGATESGDVVMMGSHRDAMAFGAIDPGSGTTVMMQVADGFKALADRGWRPARPIAVASWDGHELGLWGSLSLAYARGDDLRKHVVQYVNTDQLTTGTPYRAAMSPELWGFGREIAAVVSGIDGKPLLASETAKKPLMFPPGGGSDHQTFLYWLGIPSSSTGYHGHFGAHHSAEDNIAGLATYDPGFKEAIVTAQFTGVQVMRAAGAVAMPLRLSDVAVQLSKDLIDAKKSPQYVDIDFSGLKSAIATYRDAAKIFDASLMAAERSGDRAAISTLEHRAMIARDAFWMPEGLAYNKYWHTIDRNVAAFPEVSYASYETSDRDAKITAALDRLRTAIGRATAAISH